MRLDPTPKFEEFQAAAGGPCTVKIVAECDHFYNGKQEVVAEIVSRWLVKTLRGKA
ncbi:MAG: hypothetical protein Q8K18_02425 [Burkholderiales bacterium]|nr:hypothetical protein [Burkholderiales bacterium]